MKKTILLILLKLLISFIAIGQIEQYEAKQILEPTTYVIDIENMLGRLLDGDDISKRRQGIQFNIPSGTKEWYYIISASEDKISAEKKEKGMQLLASITSIATKGIINTENAMNALDFVTAPKGTIKCNTYHLPNKTEYSNFIRGKGFNTFEYGSKTNIKQGKCKITNANHKGHIGYLGVQNDTNSDCLVTIEIVALVSKRGWTPQLKRIMSDGFKTEMLKTEMTSLLTEREIGFLSDCAASKITSSLTLDEAAELNSYDYMSRYRNIFQNCADELGYTEKLDTPIKEKVIKNKAVESNGFKIKDKSYFEGVWNDQNSKIIITSGRYAIIWDNGSEISGFWEFEDNIISFEMNGKYIAHKVMAASENEFKYYSITGDTTIFTAVRRNK